jgi:hypothetical protein
MTNHFKTQAIIKNVMKSNIVLYSFQLKNWHGKGKGYFHGWRDFRFSREEINCLLT